MTCGRAVCGARMPVDEPKKGAARLRHPFFVGMLRAGRFADSYGRMPYGVSPAGFCGLPVEKSPGFCRGLSSAEHFTALSPGTLWACLSRAFRWFSRRVLGKYRMLYGLPCGFRGRAGCLYRELRYCLPGFYGLVCPASFGSFRGGFRGSAGYPYRELRYCLPGFYGLVCPGALGGFLGGFRGSVGYLRERCGFSGGVLRIFEGVAGPGDGVRVRNYFRGHSPTSMSRMSVPSITSRTAVRTLCSPYSPAAPGLTCSRSYTGS